METQLFDRAGWDQLDTVAFVFYDIVTKVQIGDIPPGTKFGHATVDFQLGTLQLYKSDEEFFKFKLGLVVLLSVKQP